MENEVDLFHYNELIQEIKDWNHFKQNHNNFRKQLKILFKIFDSDLGGDGCSISDAGKNLKPGTWFHQLHFPWDEIYAEKE